MPTIRTLKSAATLSLLVLTTGACLLQAAKKRSADALKYLPPTAFAELPGDIVRDLLSRKCMIPQYPKSWTATDRINVVRGEFAKPGQKDWSVVCADATDDTLLVYWTGVQAAPAEIPLGSRESYFVTASIPKDMLEEKYSEQLNGIKPDHEAIGITGHDNQTVVHYFQDGKSLALRTKPRP